MSVIVNVELQATDDVLNSAIMSVNSTVVQNVLDMENLDMRVSQLEIDGNTHPTSIKKLNDTAQFIAIFQCFCIFQ